MNRDLFLILLCVATSALGSEPVTIPVARASYVIYSHQDMLGGHSYIPSYEQTATFYTFNGDHLRTVDITPQNHNRLPDLVDRAAPKPQPVRSEVQYWPAIKIGFGMTKGVPGDFIMFRDKHGNCIE